MKIKTIVYFSTLAIGISLVLYILYKPNRWTNYYYKKLEQGPRLFISESLQILPPATHNNIALDLGASVGNETLLLLQKGFTVIAVDNQQLAINLMLQRSDIQLYRNHLQTITSSFEQLDFNTIPSLDLVIASYALPFCSPDQFDRVWNNIVKKIKIGGYFIGHFFDPNFNVFTKADRLTMTFHTKENVIHLLHNFNIITLHEVKEEAAKKSTYDHFYEIVAQKKY